MPTHVRTYLRKANPASCALCQRFGALLNVELVDSPKPTIAFDAHSECFTALANGIRADLRDAIAESLQEIKP